VTTIPFADGETDPIVIGCRTNALLDDDIPALVRAFHEQNRIASIQATVDGLMHDLARARTWHARFLKKAEADGVTEVVTPAGRLWIETITEVEGTFPALGLDEPSRLRLETPVSVLRFTPAPAAPAEVRRCAR
jgi:hypothetical protein